MKTKIILAAIIIVLTVATASGFYYSVKYKTEYTDKETAIAKLNSQISELTASSQKNQASDNNLAPTPIADQKSKLLGLDLTQFQSVHLVDGTNYFGKITDSNASFIRLSDVYYIPPSANGSNPSPQLSLAKRGSELSGPQDGMNINLSNVLYIETMKPDSQVIMAIKAYESQPAAK